VTVVEGPASYRDVFAVREYRYLFSANLLSLIGDQLTAIALSFIVYYRSGSPTLAALAYAGSYATWILGGPVLSVLADRYPRRRVLVTCDLARAGLVLLLTIPALPALALVALAFAANLFRPPFQSARASLMPDILDRRRYIVANGLDNIVAESAQVIGFAAGGFLIALFSARGVLLADAATFLISALLIAIGVRHRSATAAMGTGQDRSWMADVAAGAALIFRDRTLRAYLLLFWLACLVYGTEGLVAPLARQYGGGAAIGGLLLAAMPLGVAIGGVLITRVCPPAWLDRLMVPLAVVSCIALLPIAVVPPLPVLLGLLILSGLAGSFSVPLNALFVGAVPAAYRARAIGVAVGGVSAVQGLAMVAAGAAAERLPPTTVVAAAGLAATLGVLTVAAQWPRQQPRTAGSDAVGISAEVLAGQDQAP
jgi:Na+/melibiose symporter-like transporter